jgi:hypothetical protein
MADPPDLLPFKPYEQVRTTDPDTSHDAAFSIADATVNQQRVYVIHLTQGQRGLTDEEQLAIYRSIYGMCAESTPRKRRHDLTRAGILVDSGERRLLRSGRFGIVWKLHEYL